MKPVDNCEAKSRLSQLVDQAASGEDVVVSRNGRPLARLTRLASVARKVRFGVLKGQFSMPDDFDTPLRPGVRRAFEDR